MFISSCGGKHHVTASRDVTSHDRPVTLKEAEEMYLRVLQGKEEALGSKHTSTLRIGNNIGLFYSKQGKLQKSEEITRHVLKGRERVLGEDHPDTLISI
jgi:hypothetical protein